jgi:hypothetical protein
MESIPIRSSITGTRPNAAVVSPPIASATRTLILIIVTPPMSSSLPWDRISVSLALVEKDIK